MLVYYAVFDTMDQAILMEKRIKEWRREWKLELIEKHNPAWNDLYESIL
jgi:putative endonuclease